MTTWKQTLHQLSHLVETEFDELRQNLKKRLKYDQPVQVVPYASYGSTDTLYVKGRVFEQQGEIEHEGPESTWNNLLATYRRFESDEIPGLTLTASIGGARQTSITDDEGYFKFALPAPADMPVDQLWHSVTLSVPDQAVLTQPTAVVEASVLVPPPDCDFGIISDIDDTVMVTNATSLLKMARLTFLHSASTRLPFAGVAAFYRALTGSGSVPRPIFYVSSSPWNLYDFLIEFMDLNRIPRGPLLLRDFGIDKDKFIQSSHRKHKIEQILHVMDAYPHLPFILIGDSGQHDPEIYLEVLETRANQVRAIYIRDVSADSTRTEEVCALAEKTCVHNVDLLLVTDTLAAAQHAVEHGYITADSLPEIEKDFASDTAPTTPIESLLDE